MTYGPSAGRSVPGGYAGAGQTRVIVESPHGSTTAVLEVTKGIHPEVVGALHGFGHRALGRVAKGRGSAFGHLNTLRYDPLSGQASHKEICVRVRKA